MIVVDLLAVGATCARLYAAVLLGWGAVAKLQDPLGFEGALAGYRLVPPAAVGPFARTLPWLESLAALLLLAPSSASVIGIGAAAGLLGLFGAAVAVNLARGRRVIDCGCGGPPRPAGPGLAAHNLALAALLISTATTPTPGAAGLAVAAATAATAFLLNLAQAQLASAAARQAA